jgi:hypothetical protein
MSGASGRRDVSLGNAVTENGAFSLEADLGPIVGEGMVIRDMIFDPVERGTRFAIGNAGVFFTLDGKHWMRLLSSTALSGYPVSAYFDRVSDPANRALYVAVSGRSILKLSPIPIGADLSITKSVAPDTVETGKSHLHNQRRQQRTRRGDIGHGHGHPASLNYFRLNPVYCGIQENKSNRQHYPTHNADAPFAQRMLPIKVIGVCRFSRSPCAVIAPAQENGGPSNCQQFFRDAPHIVTSYKFSGFSQIEDCDVLTTYRSRESLSFAPVNSIFRASFPKINLKGEFYD